MLRVAMGIGMSGLNGTIVWSETEHMTEEEWARVALALGGRTGARARRGGNARRFVNAVIWVARTGAFWSDLPPLFGSWHTIYVRFLRWMRGSQWYSVVEALDEGAIKEDMRRMIKIYLDRDIARDMRRKVLAGRPVGMSAMEEQE